MENIKNSILQ